MYAIRQKSKAVRSTIWFTNALLLLSLLFPAFVAEKAYAAVLNVTSYGANGSDSNDDTSAFQSAINASSSGDTIYIPNGVYRISSALQPKSGTSLVGQSEAGTVLLYTGSGNEIIALSNKTGVELAEFTLNGNNNTSLYSAIYAHKGGEHHIHDLTIKSLARASGFGPFGVYLVGTNGHYNDGVTDSIIENTTFLDIGNSSLWGSAFRIAWGSHSNQILNNTINRTGRGGILANDGASDLVIIGNTITNTGLTDQKLSIEVWQDCDRAIIEDNVTDSWISVHDSNNSAVRNNTIERIGYGTYAKYGLELIGSKNVVFTDNVVDSGMQLGITVAGSNPARPNHYAYWGYNSFENMLQWGAQIQGGTATAAYHYFYKNDFNDTIKNHPAALYPGSSGYGFRVNGNVTDFTLDNNNIKDNDDLGIQFTTAAGVDRFSFVNNAITGNGAASINAYPSAASHLIWSGNTVSGNGTNTQLTSRGFSNAKPTASFSAASTGTAGVPVSFTNTSSDSDGSIAHVLWDFGAGIPSTTSSPSYTYDKPGTYRVTLLVWDNGGRGSIKEHTITISSSGSDTQAPTVPQSFVSTGVTTTTASFSWSASSDNVGVAGYRIYRNSILVGTTASLAFTDTSLTPDTTYSYTIKAYDAANNESSASSAVSVTTDEVPSGTPLTVNNATTGTGLHQFNFNGTWTAGSNVDSYNGDNHWSNVTNAYYEVKFEGTQAKLYSEKWTNMGIVAVSIDGGAETMVDLYQSTRQHIALVYTSPVLADDEHTLRVRITGNRNASSTGNYHVADRVDVITAAPPAGLPSPWLQTDIGSVGIAGDAEYASGVFTVYGSGSDIWGTGDQFHYVYRTLYGDGEIVARVSSVENTDSNAKAGVMIRDSLDANAKHALMNITPGSQTQFLRRTSTGGTTSYTLGNSQSAPHWVRLVRSGSTFTAYESADGSSWTQVGSNTISMGTNIYIGLVVLSKNNGQLNESAFEQVTVTD
ncbi:glycosyl hydrolase family 28-related protein [Paenibacillus sp. PL2-23]|uniref:PKD domain-containing protein n=1 Tax=Paenibacillus sp. PL2-23 TaxID=2100729 RepID=UPI0030F91936